MFACSPRARRFLRIHRDVDVINSSRKGLPAPGVERFGVEVHASHSHTEARLYSWDGGPDPSGMSELATAREEVGIATGSPTEAGLLVKTLILRVLAQAEELGEIISMAAVRATGGMRKLRQENSKLANEITAAVNQAVSGIASPSLQSRAYRGMHIISAKEEAAFCWTATQFLSGAFAKGKVRNHSTPSSWNQLANPAVLILLW